MFESIRVAVCVLLFACFVPFNANSQTITITSPNGGESWAGCTQQNITWTSSGTSNFYNIDYSIDNGQTWVSVASAYNTTSGTFPWTLPNLTSNTAIIRVSDFNTPAISDESDGFFSMVGPLILQSPNGGENWVANTIQTVTWAANGTSNSYKLEYSTNGGVQWLTIINTLNTTGGTYSWTVPNNPSANCLIRITDKNNASCMIDESDNTFSIISELQVTAPNGGEVYKAYVGQDGGTYLMNNVPVTTNNGDFYDSGGETGNYGSSQNFTKTFTPDIPTNKLKVTFEEFRTHSTSDYLRIYNGPNTSSQLIGTYSVTNIPPAFTSTHATGALTFRFISNSSGVHTGWKAHFQSVGTQTQNITWSTTGTSLEFDIDFTTDGGNSWSRIVSNLNTTGGVYAWNVPNHPSTNCKVRITDANNGSIIDTSDATFTIQAADPWFTVLDPNGGEFFYPNTVTNIDWQSAFTTNSNVVIEYSTDNGGSWLSVVTSTPNDGNYQWNIPNTPSTTCLVRVSEFGNASVNDVSDATFTIRPYITVTTPNGGETLTGCDPKTVSWLTGGTSGTFDVDFSTDNGATWNVIANNYSSGSSSPSYSWSSVVNVNSSQGLVRVRDASDTTKGDTSNATFSITKTSYLTITSPNGGENWITGTQQGITFPTFGGISTVRIRYSTNGGANWTTITNNATGGYYVWTIPNLPSNQCMIKVEDVSNPTCNFDTSDAVFTIVSDLTVTVPNGGQTYQSYVGTPGGPYYMNNIPVTLASGDFYDNAGPTANYSSSQNFTKTFTPDVPGNKLKVTFTDFRTHSTSDYLRVYNGPNTSSQLIGTYSVTTMPPTFTSTHSTGALTFRFVSNSSGVHEGWKAFIQSVGTPTETITWSTVGTSNEYHVEYSTNSGAGWTRIVSYLETTNGQYVWNVPNTPTSNALVRVIDAGNGSIIDTSDATFTINASQPWITVDYPNTNVITYPNTNLTINWTSAFLSNPNVKIEYSTDGGSNWLNVVNSTGNIGTYTWLVPNTPSTTCRIRVSEFGNASVNDVNDANFTIRPYITVTTPNGGNNLSGCGSTNVGWQTGGTSGTFEIDYSLDSGATWTAINSNYSSGSSSPSVSWSIPNIPTSKGLVRVRDVADSTKGDTSNSVFNIIPTVNLTLLSPNGGENWITGTVQPITYNAVGGVTNVRLYYSTNGGSSWTTITNNTSGGLYNWTVPNLPSNQCMIKVEDVSNPACNNDTSNAYFTIISTITVTSPNGGENWQSYVGGPSQTSHLMNNIPVTINTGDFYDNGGPTGNYSSSQNFTKTFTPDVPGNKLKVTWSAFRTHSTSDYIRVYNGPNTSSQLIGTYSVTSTPPTFTSTHATGALTFRFVSNSSGVHSGWRAYIQSVGTPTETITWNKLGTSGDYHIEYSTNAGTNWTRIVSYYPSTNGQYVWNVPNTPTTQALVRVIDAGNGSIIDTSDANFTINASVPWITVDYPNTGIIVYPNTSINIQWTEAFLVNPNVMIEYSTDGGSNWNLITSSTPNIGTYTWLVPNTPSTQCRVRVSEVGNATVNDISDVNFTIRPYITVTTPNGGNNLSGCGSTNIGWVTGGTSQNYSIDYSLDSGQTWVSVNSNYTSGSGSPSVSWSIPNTATSKGLVRVRDNADTTKGDTSNSVFNIIPTVNLTLLSPNGGQNWITGTTQQITYNASGGVTNVRLYYSTNNGANWTTITNNTSGGLYNWTVPNVPSTQCLIRVQDINNPTCNNDTSDAVFTIISTLTVTSPNGSENWQSYVGQPSLTSHLMNNIPVTLNTGDFYDNGGPTGNYSSSQNYTKTFTPDVPGNKLKVTWTAFRTHSTSDYLRVYNGPNTSSQLIGTYSVTSTPPTFTSTHATGALTFRFVSNSSGVHSGWRAYIQSVGTPTETITWNKIGTSETYHVEYSSNAGSNWTRVVSYLPSTTGQYVWNVPNTPTTTALVRVIDAGNGVIIDTSDANFTINASVPWITVDYPNTGLITYPNTNMNIQWTDAFLTSPTVMIEYSTNAGTSWNTITTATPNIGTYTWLVPNTPSTQCRVRVSEVGNATVNDISDVNFTIRPYITVTTPNGGENLSGCGSKTIGWQTGGTSQTFAIDYSIDNGATWTTINGNYTSGSGSPSYNWTTVPNVAASQGLVRVRDVADTTKGDTSNATWNIIPTVNLTLLTPNGGQNWITGTTQSITYNATGGVTNVRLYYSVDSGATWTTITNNTSGGLYNWTVPNTPSSEVMIRVQDVSNPTCNQDESDAVFTIISDLTVTYPNGGENLQSYVGNPPLIANTMNNVPVTLNSGDFYDTGGPTGNYGSSQNYTKTFTPDVPGNKLKVTWTAFRTHSTSDYLRVYNGPNTSSQLIGTYSVTSSPPTFTSTHATGALTFRWVSNSSGVHSGWRAYIQSVGTPTETVTWNTVGTSGDYHIEYSSNGGTNWTRMVSYYPSTTGTYTWNVPNTPTTTALVRVIDAGNGAIIDTSDAPFTINATVPWITVDYPNTNIVTYPNTNLNITWTSAFTVNANVMIEYSTDNGTSWNTIASSTPNIGTYTWLVPNAPTTQALIRVSEVGNSAVNDVSNSTFTIRKFITVTSPNGGNSLNGCASTNVTWLTGGTSGVFDVDYSTDNGLTWNVIANNHSSGSSSVSYNWGTIPNIVTGLGLVRVRDDADSTKGDTSDAVFSINQTNNVVVSSPNGGEVWIAGTTQAITYPTFGGVTNVRIRYSADSGATWVTITNNTSGGLYNWNVPNIPSTEFLIRVEDVSKPSCNFDISNATFTVLSEVQVTAPNGGENWNATVGQQQSTPHYMNNIPVDIGYGDFYDNGGPTGNYSSSQNFTKTFTPDVPGNKLRVTFTEFRTHSTSDYLRIYNGPNTSSQLLGTYSVTTMPPVITSSHATGALTFRFISNSSGVHSGWKAYFQSIGTATENITWSKIGTSEEYDIDYSTNAGITWERIVSEYPSTAGNYAWNVPNTPSAQCLVRVTDAGNNVISDTSNNTFTIGQAVPFFQVTSPNGGQTWYEGQVQNITWSSAFVSTNVVIEYSTNTGNSWNTIANITSNNGSYPWTIPPLTVPFQNCLIRVSDYANTSINDVSDAVFTLAPRILVTSPNGPSGLWRACTQSTINFTAGPPNNFKIELSIDSGSTWQTVNGNFSSNATNVVYNWSIPNTPSPTCLIKVTDFSNQQYWDVSDSIFEISPTVTINYPTFGGSVTVGQVVNITWFKDGVSNFYDIEYSTNGGNTWNTIAFNYFTTGNSYAWTVPNTVSTNCVVRVTDNNASCKSDVSDIPFTITTAPQSVQVISPNGGDSLIGCATDTIFWTDSLTSGTYNIDYSLDGGLTWTNIVAGLATSNGYYVWTLPNAMSQTALVRVSDALSPTKSDMSDQAFEINQSIYAVIQPSGPTSICAGQQVVLTSNKATGNTWSPSGATTQSIVVSSSGSHTLTVDSSGCQATSQPISITVNANPPAPSITPAGTVTICAGSSAILSSSSAVGNTWTPSGATTKDVTITAAGSYTVTYTDGNGCSSTSNPTVVNVQAQPSSPLAGSNSPVVQGLSINLTASTVSGATYYWTGPNGFTSTAQNPTIPGAQPTFAGTYSVVAVVNGCTSLVSTTNVQVTAGGGLATVTGLVKTETGQPIRTATVSLAGASVDSFLTAPGVGTYSLQGIAGQAHTISCWKNNDTVTNNGVTTFDLILMQRHILTTDTLGSAYKVIAADVDRGGSVTTLDIILTRRVILQQVPTFPKGRLWVFVPEDQTYATYYSPWPFDTAMTKNALSTEANQNFIGCHLGDVNNSYNPNTAKTVNYARDIYFEMPTVYADGEEYVTVPVRVKDFKDVSGFQFTMDWDASAMDLVEVTDGLLEVHAGMNEAANGKLALVWTEPNAESVTLNDGSVVFNLRFKVKSDQGSPIAISGSKIMMEAVSADLQYLRIRMTEGAVAIGEAPSAAGSNLNQGYILHQNYPNPFGDQTEIRFEVPELSQVEFQIHDISGNLVWRQSGSYAQGEHKISWLGENQQGQKVTAGIYFVKMRTKEFIGTVKMIYMR